MQTSFPQQVHLTDYLNIIRKRKWVVIIFFLAVVSLVTAASFQTTPVYRATTRIIIENQSPLSSMVELTPDNFIKQDEYYQTQYNLLRSRSLACKVIEDLELWKDFHLSKTERAYPSTPVLPGSESRGGGLASETRDALPRASTSQITEEWYLSNLRITPVRGSRLADISFLGSSPGLITRIVNTHAHAFIEQNIQRQKEAAHQAIDWLRTQLQQQKAEVEASQRAIYEYNKKNDIVSSEGRQNIVSQKLMELNSDLTKVKAERMAREAIYNQLKDFSENNEDLFPLPEVSQDSVIQNLRSRLIELKAQQLEIAAKFGPKHPKVHPRMIELESGIKRLREEIRSEVQRVSDTIKAEFDRAVAVEQSVQQMLDAQKEAAMSFSEKVINHGVLRRQAESNQHIYDILLKQAKEISLTSLMESSNVRIVDEAEAPRFPIKPKIFLNILLAVVLGIFMGTGLAFFFEYMDNTLKIPEDVPRRLGMPVLGVLPYDKSLKKSKTPIFPRDDHPGTKYGGPEAYPIYDISSRLPVRLQLTEQSVSGQVLVVASAAIGEGKTTVLANLGINLARMGLRVLMVDCDLQRPALHRLFGIKNEGGLVKAATQIFSHAIDAGSLEEYSVDDLFFLISLKKCDGQLTIANDTQTMTALFQDGSLVHIENQNNPVANRLGVMLLRGGFITESQLEDAMERNQRTGQPLGYILINAGHITRDKLQGPLRLQMEEHLQILFSWKRGSFVFRPGRVETCENERVNFGEDYAQIIRRLGHLAGSRLLESEVLSRVMSCSERSVYILPAGMASSRSNGQVNPSLLARYLEILKQRFHVVLMDTPLLDEAGAAPLCALADGVILVVKAGHLSVKVLNEAKTGLSEAKARIIGAILNQAKTTQQYHNK